MRPRNACRISSISNAAGRVSISTVDLHRADRQAEHALRRGPAPIVPQRRLARGSAVSADRKTGRDPRCERGRVVQGRTAPGRTGNRSSLAIDTARASRPDASRAGAPSAPSSDSGLSAYCLPIGPKLNSMRAGDRVAQVLLARRAGCLPGRRLVESSKSAMNTLAPEFSALMIILRVDRSGDLDTTVPDRFRNLGDAPLAFADVPGLGQKVGQLAGIEARLAFAAGREQAAAARFKTAMQFREQVECGRRQHRGMRRCSGWLGNDGGLLGHGHTNSLIGSWVRPECPPHSCRCPDATPGTLV
jgi:hypothetical protein